MSQSPIPLNRLANRFRSAVSNSKGITLIETVIALAIFTSAGTALLLGVGAAHRSTTVVSGSAIAENLARNQMEYAISQTYVAAPGDYTSLADSGLSISIPAGYAVAATTQVYLADDGLPGSIEKIVVTVNKDGKDVLVLESLRSGP